MISRILTCILAVSALTLQNCSREDIVTSPFTPSTSAGFIVIYGDTVRMSAIMPGFISTATVSKTIGTFPNNSSGIYASQLYDTTSLDPAIIIKKGTLFFSDTVATNAQFIDCFQTGTQNWSVNALNGVEVIYVDPQGTVWSTSEAGGYQGSHTFKITESTSFMDNGVMCVQIKAVFNCTLYHPAYQPIELLQGVYVGIFRNL
jgi:hypothetical protein